MLYNKIMHILGINVSELSKEALLTKVKELLTQDKQHYIVTPNPEIILAALKDEEFFYILNEARLAPADGFGLQLAAALSGKKLPRLTGSDLSPAIIELARQEKKKTAIIIWRQGLSRQSDLIKTLNNKYPGLQFLVLEHDRQIKLEDEAKLKLEEFQPEILFVALGAPEQEKLIWHNLTKLPSIKLALGVGGTFDFLSGKIKRAPQIMRQIGLEWLFRLIQQPQRFKRIFRATCVFSAKIFVWRFINPFLYRKNVVGWLYRKTNNGYQVLLVERQDEANHWQLPQGGRDGESLARAGQRELEEELGTNKLQIKKTYKNLYHYKAESMITKIYGYKGQSQGLAIAEFLGEDNDIKINFWDHRAWTWVDSNKVVEKVHAVRQKGTAIFFKKFQEYINN